MAIGTSSKFLDGWHDTTAQEIFLAVEQPPEEEEKTPVETGDRARFRERFRRVLLRFREDLSDIFGVETDDLLREESLEMRDLFDRLMLRRSRLP